MLIIQMRIIELVLWLVFLICSTVVDEVNSGWAVESFKAYTLESGLRDEQSVELSLTSLFWVDKVRGPSFDRIWDNGTKCERDRANSQSSCSSDSPI